MGDKVILRKLGTEGTILALDEAEAEVQAGALRMRVPLEELKRKDEQTAAVRLPTHERKHSGGASATSPSPSPGFQLDLRGQRAEDAIEFT